MCNIFSALFIWAQDAREVSPLAREVDLWLFQKRGPCLKAELIEYRAFAHAENICTFKRKNQTVIYHCCTQASKVV